ncbi:MAG: PQQ-binding-like beta-propeller repeat protein [Actinobacteria bacterium]|nr:PQQ-binding-like beta-propeller repeat protein [Actinomycetota bacterium]
MAGADQRQTGGLLGSPPTRRLLCVRATARAAAVVLAVGGAGLFTTGCDSGNKTVRAGADREVTQEAGTERWQFVTEDFVSSYPAVADGVVYVGDDGGVVYALDAGTGTERWRVDTGELESYVAVADGVVYGSSSFAESDGAVIALAADTGTERWRLALDGYPNQPVVADGVVYVGTEDVTESFVEDAGSVYAIDAENGTELWRFDAGGGVYGPVVASGKVYAGSANGAVYAIDAASGTELWRAAPVESHEAPARTVYYSSLLTVADGVVYAGSSGEAGKVYALDAESGNELWRFSTGGAILSAPAVANGVLYAGGDAVFALDAESGNELWRFSPDDLYEVSLAMSEGVVYAASSGATGTVFAIDAESGTGLWRFEINDSAYPPVVADGVVYLGGAVEDNPFDPTPPKVYAINA